jgi:hypothetical protein
LNTSIELSKATNAHRPSGVTAAPNGWPPTPSIAVRTDPSAPDAAAAVLHAGDGSARDGSGTAGPPAVAAAAVLAGEAGAEAVRDAADGGGVLEVQPAQTSTAVTAARNVRAVAACALARSERMPQC